MTAGDGYLSASTLELHLGFQPGPPGGGHRRLARWRAGGSGPRLMVGRSMDTARGTAIARLRHRGGPSRPAPGQPVENPAMGGQPGPERSQVTLHEEIPLGRWRLPQIDGEPRRFGTPAGGAHVIVAMGRGRGAALARLEAARVQLAEDGISAFALSIDGAGEHASESRQSELAPSCQAAARTARPARSSSSPCPDSESLRGSRPPCSARLRRRRRPRVAPEWRCESGHCPRSRAQDHAPRGSRQHRRASTAAGRAHHPERPESMARWLRSEGSESSPRPPRALARRRGSGCPQGARPAASLHREVRVHWPTPDQRPSLPWA